VPHASSGLKQKEMASGSPGPPPPWGTDLNKKNRHPQDLKKNKAHLKVHLHNYNSEYSYYWSYVYYY